MYSADLTANLAFSTSKERKASDRDIISCANFSIANTKKKKKGDNSAHVTICRRVKGAKLVLYLLTMKDNLGLKIFLAGGALSLRILASLSPDCLHYKTGG